MLLKPMTDSSLFHHVFPDCLWIRCASRGSFINSPSLKTVAEKYLDGGGKLVVIDLELCPGVDSTFMGTLAGLARRAMAVGGSVEVASPTPRTRAAMEGLGLDMLLSLEPAFSVWTEDKEKRRAVLEQQLSAAETPQEDLSELDRTRHVLEAHKVLRSMNKQNDEAFGYVCETLEDDLARQEEGRSR